MSLENEVSRLTAAIEALTAALTNAGTVSAAPVVEAKEEVKAEAPRKGRGRPKTEAVAEEPAPAVEEVVEQPAEEPVAELEDDLGIDDAPAAITRDELKAKFSALAKAPGKGREAVLSIFKKLGANNFDGIPESKFAEAVALIDKA